LLISESNQKIIKERFEKLKNQVVIQFYESSLECASCSEIKQLLQELNELSDLLSLEVYNLYIDEDKAKQAGIDKAPTIVLTDDTRKDYGIRFYGAPSGYEFATLLEDIIMVSQGDSGLQPATRQKLSALTSAVDLAVFVTPT
jgi:glutaredoxin-like protein